MLGVRAFENDARPAGIQPEQLAIGAMLGRNIAVVEKVLVVGCGTAAHEREVAEEGRVGGTEIAKLSFQASNNQCDEEVVDSSRHTEHELLVRWVVVKPGSILSVSEIACLTLEPTRTGLYPQRSRRSLRPP